MPTKLGYTIDVNTLAAKEEKAAPEYKKLKTDLL